MIILKDINVTFAPNTVMERKALRNLCLQITDGEFITVIGSNGAGKSTLLNTIAGEILPNSGEIIIDKTLVTKKPGYERAYAVAKVFQDPLAGSCGDLTIAENMALALKRGQKRGLKIATSKEKCSLFKELLSELKLGLEDRLDTNMSMLSGGQRQAISLLMSTLSPLKILLLDEHTSALDPKTANFVMELTKKIVKDKKLTTLIVTHSLNQALQYGNRTIILHEGHVIADLQGKTRKSMTPSELMNFFGKSVDDDRLLLQK